ncbi:MAG: FCD domain-containing protein [Oscillospiraceae bacterium]
MLLPNITCLLKYFIKCYIKRNDEEKIFSLDKEFHSMLYHFCNNEYWYKLVNNVSPLFDRTTILSFRCNEKNRILHDHEELVKAIEQKNKKEAASISRLHMTRYTENIDMMKQSFPEYFK